MSLLVVSDKLDAEDLVVLLLALDQLERHTSNELAKAGTNNIKQAALINMQSRLLVVRGKLRVMQGALSTSETLPTKDSIATAVKQLSGADDKLREVGSFLYVCLVALQANGGDHVDPDVATVLNVAYEKLVLDANRNIRDAIEALGQDGGQ